MGGGGEAQQLTKRGGWHILTSHDAAAMLSRTDAVALNSDSCLSERSGPEKTVRPRSAKNRRVRVTEAATGV